MNLESFIGIPFVDGGRDRAGIDCWGLVRLFLEEEAAIADLPDYAGTPAAELAAVASDISAAAASPTWRAVERRNAHKFDVVALVGRERVNGRPRNLVCHVGVLINPRQLLHIEEHTDSVIVRLDHFSVQHRIAGFYRHRDLAAP